MIRLSALLLAASTSLHAAVVRPSLPARAPSVAAGPVLAPVAPGPVAAAPSLATLSAPAFAPALAPALAPLPGAAAPAFPAAARAPREAPAAPSAQRGTPAAITLGELFADPALAARVFDGLTGARTGERDAEDFIRAAKSVYATTPRRSRAALMRLRLHLPERGGPEEARRRRVWRAVLELPRVTAEGMVRANLRAPSPADLSAGQLRDGWARTPAGEPVADAVIVGGGPAGLSTALQAADRGARVVLFEAGFLGQSFSDAGMRSVYRMRTNAARNSLVQAPFSRPELVARAGMLARLPVLRALGRVADAARRLLDGSAPTGRALAGLDDADPAVPSARVELLQHFAEAADEAERLGARLVERAAVASVVKRPDGLWEVITAAGHRQLARRLVLAQGQVGPDFSHGRAPDAIVEGLPAGAALTLGSRADLSREARRWYMTTAAQSQRARVPFVPVVHDALLGAPEVREHYARLPPKSGVAVVGSGESAAKAALELLRVNPRLKVHLFVKEPLAAAQLQIPAAHAAPEAIRAAQDDPALAARTLDEWKRFGTPVTPDTLADILDERERRHVIVHELGERFDARAGGPARLLRSKDGSVEIRVRGRIVAIVNAGFVWAGGYDRASLREDAPAAGLERAGALRRVGGTGLAAGEYALGDGRLASAGDPSVFVVGAQSFALSADSAIPGAVARAARVAEALARP